MYDVKIFATDQWGEVIAFYPRPALFETQDGAEACAAFHIEGNARIIKVQIWLGQELRNELYGFSKHIPISKDCFATA